MLQVNNRTPFCVEMAAGHTERGADVLLIGIKATLTLEALPTLADVQRPIVGAYAYLGEPVRSSLTAVPELCLPTGGTDVVLLGDAWAPDGRAVATLDACLSIAGRQRPVRVHGDRVWRSERLGWASSPVPFTRMPLIYERAYGGCATSEAGELSCEPYNPIGVGYRMPRQQRSDAPAPLPNLSDPRLPDPTGTGGASPAGYGWIAPDWLPRRARAGTYDAAWQATRAPFLPDDFDRAYLRVGPSELYFEAPLRGGEPIVLQCLAQQPWLSFCLPVYRPQVRVRLAGRRIRGPEPTLELVLLEPNRGTFCLLWRAAIPCDKQVLRVESVRVELA